MEKSRTPNHLITETSPYLLQHAYNPVDWYPWGEEAFAKARDEDKPVLVSIGYSACHWCHVMEHESFEDAATAAVMNERFVNIKVDMEERPDVDQIYMSFVQLTTGRGGWPMNVFLTPDKRPFFGGTYFPPSPRYGMPSWQQILISIADAYSNKRNELEHSANEVVAELRKMSTASTPTGSLSTDICERAFNAIWKTFDSVNGGFGGAPKFPPSMVLEFLLRYHHRTGEDRALAMVRHSCDKMAWGGIYDQLGGGFHRYAVDAIWLVPHFEKMLYDNAQLIRVYLHLFQVTGEERYRQTAVETLEYILREMTHEAGGFFSSQDADSEGEEGKFFIWSSAEVIELLGEENARIFSLYYDVSEDGNFEGHNILNIRQSQSEVAAALKISESQLLISVENFKKILFGAREQRIKPHRDEKVLSAWNGLMLAAFADAAAVLGEQRYLDQAKRNADFILDQMMDGGRLMRTWKDGVAKLNGYVEDYANVADGFVRLFEASGELKYLNAARFLADTMITEFWDAEEGGFFFTSNDHEELIVRNKDFYDNATPSGNSTGADVLLRLGRLSGEEKYERFGVSILRLAAQQMKRHPQGFGRALATLEFQLAEAQEIAVIGPRGSELERAVLEKYLPTTVIAMADGDEPGATIPVLEGRSTVNGLSAAYLCSGFVCERPVTSAADLEALMQSRSAQKPGQKTGL